MRPLSVLTSVVLLAALLPWTARPSSGDDKKPDAPKRSIQRKDPRFDKLIAKDAKLETLAGGYAWTEGPVWVNKDGGYLLFSDIPNNSVFKWQQAKTPGAGLTTGPSLFLKPSGYTGAR